VQLHIDDVSLYPYCIDLYCYQVINTLALFNTPSERQCSRAVTPDLQWKYHHDLPIQGILKVQYTRGVRDV
jgi:hypothetical protein